MNKFLKKATKMIGILNIFLDGKGDDLVKM
jgi:hypothetical protein